MFTIWNVYYEAFSETAAAMSKLAEKLWNAIPYPRIRTFIICPVHRQASREAQGAKKHGGFALITIIRPTLFFWICRWAASCYNLRVSSLTCICHMIDLVVQDKKWVSIVALFSSRGYSGSLQEAFPLPFWNALWNILHRWNRITKQYL